MSIDEVIDAAHAYSFKYHCYRTLGKKAPMEKWEAVRDSVDALRAAIEQHVAEAVAREREECAKVCDAICLPAVDHHAHGYNLAALDCSNAIRARANNEVTK